MTSRRTPGPYDRNLLATAPAAPGYGPHQNYDMGLLNSQPPVVISDVPKEVEQAILPPSRGITPIRIGPFWNTTSGKIVIAVVVIVALIIAIVGGSLGAAAAASVRHTAYPGKPEEKSTTFSPSIASSSKPQLSPSPQTSTSSSSSVLGVSPVPTSAEPITTLVTATSSLR